MDLTTIGFYACICGALSAFAPASLRLFPRFGVGAVVGVAAAAALPFLQGMMGGY